MNITTKNCGGKTSVTLQGMLDSASSAQFQELVQNLISQDSLDAVFELDGLEYISSQGVRTFLTLLKTAKTNGGKLVFKGIRPAVREIFDLSGLSQVMTIE